MGYRIRERREELRMSQEELSLKSSVSRQTISSLENTPGKSVSTRTLEKLASALNTTVGELFLLQVSKEFDITKQEVHTMENNYDAAQSWYAELEEKHGAMTEEERKRWYRTDEGSIFFGVLQDLWREDLDEVILRAYEKARRAGER